MPNEFTYGRANRPQTPINGIIGNRFGEEAGSMLQSRYKHLKDVKKNYSPRSFLEVRYTNAKLKADEFTKTKNTFDVFGKTRQEFKLKRF